MFKRLSKGWSDVYRVVSAVVDGHTSRVFAAAFHPQQMNEFVSGGWDSVVHFWDIRQPTSQRYIKFVHICGDGLDIRKSGREVMLSVKIIFNFDLGWCFIRE